MTKIRAKYDAIAAASTEQIFGLLSNLSGYTDWLGRSEMFLDCQQLSSGPPTVGTRYVDKGAAGELQGEIVVCDPPTHIRIQESTELRKLVLKVSLEVTIDYTLRSEGNGTRIVRHYLLRTSGLFGFVVLLSRSRIRNENQRIMMQLVKAANEFAN